MRYNEEEGQFEHLEQTAGGKELILNQTHLRSDGRPQLSEFENILFGGGWTLDGYRLDITFIVDDPHSTISLEK
ncbi:hypothetical protein DK37_01035 [Halomonas sp. SUBG004]|nr:hypothetical protein DK37_01035 [Halomonas sp. SUBG004]